MNALDKIGTAIYKFGKFFADIHNNVIEPLADRIAVAAEKAFMSMGGLILALGLILGMIIFVPLTVWLVGSLIVNHTLIAIFFVLFLTNTGNPPAMPGDSQSLTFPG